MRLVGGRPVEVEEIGDGTPVLMLHGFPIDRRSLLAGVGPLFDRRPAYRRFHVDLPGFGATPAVPDIDSSDAMVDFVLELIDELVGTEPLLIVGESWGAYIARGVVARRPDRVLGVALIVPVVIATHGERNVPGRRLLAEEAGVLDGVSEADAAIYLDGAAVVDRGSWEYARSAILPAIAAADADTVERIGARYAFAADVDAIGRPFPRPSLIVAGRQDTSVGYRDTIALLERFPRATFAVLDAAGHNLEGERPRLLEALVADWLDRVERS